MITDSRNITPRNDKGQPHGFWVKYSFDSLRYKGFFIDGRPIGYLEGYPLHAIDYEIQKFYYIR